MGQRRADGVCGPGSSSIHSPVRTGNTANPVRTAGTPTPRSLAKRAVRQLTEGPSRHFGSSPDVLGDGAHHAKVVVDEAAAALRIHRNVACTAKWGPRCRLNHTRQAGALARSTTMPPTGSPRAPGCRACGQRNQAGSECTPSLVRLRQCLTHRPAHPHTRMQPAEPTCSQLNPHAA